MLVGVLATLACGCAGADYYRLPQRPGADGSIANEVDYAFFSMVKPRFGPPSAYTEFNPDIDDEVVFFTRVGPVGRSFVLRGTLYRPGGVEHTSFTRTPHPASRGPAWWVGTVETFPMAEMRPFVGRWKLDLFLDDTLIGSYPFILADKTRIQEFRRPR